MTRRRRPRTDEELRAEIEADAAWVEPRQARLDALGLHDLLLLPHYRLNGVKLSADEFDQLLALAERGARS